MKKRILLFTFALLGMLSMKAQTLVGDMNDDGEITVSDVAELVNTAVGKTAKRYINPYKEDNTAVIGTWTSTGTSLTFRADGTYNSGGYTYKYRPVQGRIVVYNASGSVYRVYSAIEVESDYLVLDVNAAGAYRYYYKGGKVTGITLSQSSISGVIGQTYQLSATVSPSDAAIPDVAWSSSDESIATVDATGLVTVKAGGTVTITAKATDCSGKTATCTVTTPIPVSSITLDKSTLEMSIDDNYTLTATVLPTNADDTSVTWSSSNTDVATVSSKGKVMAVDAGTATITCTASDGSGVKASCTVTVSSGPDANGHAYVDLGLTSGTLWATMNVGATTADGYGNYYAWGETSPQSSNEYSWSSYRLCNGSYSTMTKYCTSSSYGTVDNQTELLPADDAAHVNWGGDWVMPSYDQLTELKTECTWTWTTQSSVNGYKVTGPNGNSIFLPAAGYRYNSSLYNAGSNGFYWSRTLDSSYSGSAWILSFNSSNVSTYYDGRYFGQSVRPVLGSVSE